MAVSPTQIFWESSFPDKFPAEFDELAARKQKFLTLQAKEKLWLHQGFHEAGEEGNSIEAVTKAFAADYTGVEIDLHYIESEQEIIVSHDMPARFDRQKILTLDRLFQESPFNQKTSCYLWLDFKNLNYGNASEALNLLAAIVRKNYSSEHVLVESSNPFMVRKISQAGLKAVWGVFYGLSSAKFSTDNIEIIKTMAVLSQCSMISLPWQVYDEQAIKLLKDFPTAVYTVNDTNEIKKFLTIPSVKIVLTDLTDFRPENE